MATTACTGIKYKFFNGSWSDWSSTLHYGYAGKSNYLVVLRFKTPKITGSFANTKLSFTIPYVRQAPYATPETGTLYFDLVSSDPTGKANSTTICSIPNSSTCNESKTWNHEDFNVHTVSFKISSNNLKADTTYYLKIGASQNYMPIGYSGYDSKYSISIEYTSYTSIGTGTVSITDNGNNTFTISGTKGSDGTNNKAKSFALTWDYDETYSHTTTSGSTINLSGSAASRTVYAKCVTTATYGSNTTKKASKTIKRYVAPGEPGKPKLATSSFRNNRLTIKQNWTYEWTAAAAGNTYSPVQGYRIRVYKNGQVINGLTTGADSNISINKNATNSYLDREGATNCKIIFDPNTLGFKPGDIVKIGLHAWALNGAGSKLWSGEGATQIYSNETAVQNAGVVRIKVGQSWKEGQVYIKAGGDWKEAETVQVKTGGKWRESE